MPSALQVVLGRILAAFASGLITWMIAKGVDIKVTQENIDALVAAGLAIFTAIYAIGHTWYNSKFNKKDVSSPTLLKTAQDDARRQEAAINHESK